VKVIFDLDGTLYMTEKSILAAVKKTSVRFGLSCRNMEYITHMIGLPSEQFLQIVFGVQTTIEILEYFRKCEREAVKNDGVCYEGIKELLSTLRAEGDKLYICSSGSLEYINVVTETLGIDHFFEKKYSFRAYTGKAEAIRELNEDGDSVIVVGDTETDYVASRQVRSSFVFCRYGYGAEGTWDEIYFTADRPADILPIAHRCRIYETIKKIIQREQIRIIGVNGVDTSGKTSFSKELSTYLQAVGIKNSVIHIDDFHNTRAVRSAGENEIDAYYNNAFNYDQLLSEVLFPLKQFGHINKTVQCLDLDKDEYINEITYSIDKDTVVILEGVLLFRDPLLSYFDLKIFIDINFDEVLKRAQIRDIPKYGPEFLNRYINKYIPIQKKYLEQCKPKENCDILIDNNNYHMPFIIKGEDKIG